MRRHKRRKRSILGILAAVLLAMTGFVLAGLTQSVGIPPPASLAIIQPDIGAFTVPVGIVMMAPLALFMVLIASSRYEKFVDRMKAAFAMSAFARHVTQPVLDLVSLAHKQKQRAIAMIEFTSEIPRRAFAAMKRTEFGPRQARTRHEFAVSLN